MKKLIIGLITLCQFPLVFGQLPQNLSSAEMYLAIRKLNILGSVLYVAAHPDDENTRLLTYFSKDRLYRAGYLSLTRGDGGQNLIGNDQGVDLGMLRTQELLAARRVDGGEQFFTRAFDFGYSKSPEETFTKWDREKILSDLVWVIRKFQPDVIITRFPTTGEGGHGHHTASSILANEAFTAAADPSRFPEQLKYVKTWQAKRILWNSFNFGGTNTTSDDQFKFDVGGYNPLLGKSYGEIAAISRSNHRSQGFGSAGTRGEALEYFKTTGGSAPANDIMDGIDLTWNRVNGSEAIQKTIDSLSSSFDLLHPENSVPGLVRLYTLINNSYAQTGLTSSVVDHTNENWKIKKMEEVKQLIEQCSGLFIDAISPDVFAVQTDSIRVNFSMNNRLGVKAILKAVKVDAFDTTMNQLLSRNRNLNFGKVLYVPANKPVTQPYWLQNKMEEGYFNVSDQQKIGQADIDPAYIAQIRINIEGLDLEFNKPVKYKFTDPVKGETYWPLAVIPPYGLHLSTDLVINVKKRTELQKVYTSYKNNNTITSGDDNFILQKGETKESDKFTFVPPGKNMVTAIGFTNNLDQQPLHDMIRIRYDHVPAMIYFKPAELTIANIDLETYNKKIGYIAGAGDKVPEALEQMGYEVNMLSEKELSRNDLSKFDAIITGVRAYNTREFMNSIYDKLMRYVSNGGNLIVQYNTNNNVGPMRAKIGPYKFDIVNKRVTDENAAVTILKPDHPVFNFPNKITQDDFLNWKQERSIYHATRFDNKEFETVLSMHDPGEDPDEGSLVIAKYGKGVFVYTGLVFFRELPAGIPGAYRLLANIIALNRKKAF